MDQAVARRTLQELIKREDLDNKKCIDCSNPNPQWASLSFAVFLCLQCAGVHRGFGVHVRSVSMDTWHEEQIRRMQLGGNTPFREFMNAYPAEGGYKLGMNPYDSYHSWAATQYREKLDADLAGKPWSPSSPALASTPGGNIQSPPGRPSSAQGLRKSRASTRSSMARPARSDSASPASFSSRNSPTPTSPVSSTPFQDQKAANESFFATLGEANAVRPDNLPPSQGGRYQGFGSTPSPQPGQQHPAYGLSSRAAPSLSELQENPGAALSKGWSLFSAAVAGASRAVTENVIQPGMERVMDPTFQASVRGYVSEASKRASDAGRTANMWGKDRFGVDVAGQVGGVAGVVKDKVTGGPARKGYSSVAQGGYAGETSALYQDNEDDEEFFDSFSESTGHSTSFASESRSTGNATAAKKQDDWDEWKDF
ncbi:uncharacterized protein FIBRA_02694 [Fibroporia radiculosa]|uniref:Arf-GAP domain-containing protein n=1 Tax=Fibroporia radiculosa TaxID=599839 RepID=J4I972_9APHY|nr:uncharacterized protein FIBRA_02694 [Fibroporia radiculosa]CCM00656.1 predicted protein [Fibroporia radiculosa]